MFKNITSLHNHSLFIVLDFLYTLAIIYIKKTFSRNYIFMFFITNMIHTWYNTILEYSKAFAMRSNKVEMRRELRQYFLQFYHFKTRFMFLHIQGIKICFKYSQKIFSCNKAWHTREHPAPRSGCPHIFTWFKAEPVRHVLQYVFTYLLFLKEKKRDSD